MPKSRIKSRFLKTYYAGLALVANLLVLFTPVSYGIKKFTSLDGIIEPLVRVLFYLGLLLGIGFIVYSGFLLMTSEGDPQKAREGQEQLTAAVIGTAFILLSVFILRVILKDMIGAPFS